MSERPDRPLIDHTTLDVNGEEVWVATTTADTIDISHGTGGELGTIRLGPGGAYAVWASLRDYCRSHFPDLAPSQEDR